MLPSPPWLGCPLWNICVTNDHGYVPLVVSNIRSFPHSWLTGFETRVTRQVQLVEPLYCLSFFDLRILINSYCSTAECDLHEAYHLDLVASLSLSNLKLPRLLLDFHWSVLFNHNSSFVFISISELWDFSISYKLDLVIEVGVCWLSEWLL